MIFILVQFAVKKLKYLKKKKNGIIFVKIPTLKPKGNLVEVK